MHTHYVTHATRWYSVPARSSSSVPDEVYPSLTRSGKRVQTTPKQLLYCILPQHCGLHSRSCGALADSCLAPLSWRPAGISRLAVAFNTVMAFESTLSLQR
jgi:hypothetical protein